MRLTRLAAVLATTALWAGAGAAADLDGVDRTIKKEPAYRSQPRYCLLVFGPQAQHRVWLVLDGDTLYVDRNGDGDLTGEGECVQAQAFEKSTHPAHERGRTIAAGDVTAGGFTHTDLSVTQTQYRRKADTSNGTGASSPQEWQDYLDGIWRQVPDGLVYLVTVNLDSRCLGLPGGASGKRVMQFAWVDGHGQLSFAARPQDAPVIHFGGPLTMRVTDDPLRRGADRGRVTVSLGTPGRGPGSFATLGYDLVPPGAHPAVEVRFPPREPGGQYLTQRYVLKQRC